MTVLATRFNCIAVQVHIPPFDRQGEIPAAIKKKAVEVGLAHLRRKNPYAYIAIVGHGERPDNLGLAHWGQWFDYDPIAGTGQQPAQYPYVSKAIEHCKRKGFTHVLKLRGDGLYGHENFLEYCHGVAPEKLLVSQMTSSRDMKMGDCVMYGPMDLMSYLWSAEHPVHASDGLIQIGTNFFTYHGGGDWNKLLREHCEFRNVPGLKWADLRYHANEFQQKGWDKVVSELQEDTFDYDYYAWGNPQWFHFKDNKMYNSINPHYYEEETFYENSSMH